MIKVGDVLRWENIYEKVLWMSCIEDRVDYISMGCFKDNLNDVTLDRCNCRSLVLERCLVDVVQEDVVKVFSDKLLDPFLDIELERLKIGMY
jgi:hypothetical protein